MCSGKCEFYKNCPVGYKEIEFEFDDVKWDCQTLNQLYDKFVDIKEARNEWKKEKKENPAYSHLSYFG